VTEQPTQAQELHVVFTQGMDIHQWESIRAQMIAAGWELDQSAVVFKRAAVEAVAPDGNASPVRLASMGPADANDDSH
jgi:hypothetical protein